MPFEIIVYREHLSIFSVTRQYNGYFYAKPYVKYILTIEYTSL